MPVRWWLLLLMVPTAAAGPMLSGVVADVPGHGPGEAVAIYSDVAVDLSGWALGDGESVWSFPEGARLAAGDEAWAVSHPAAWQAVQGGPWRWTFDLRLGDAGDEVLLLHDGEVVDAMAYGDGAWPGAPHVGATGEGVVYRPGDGSWRTPRIHRVGESDLDRPIFDVEALTVYATPDSAHGVLSGLLTEARQRLHLHVYDLASPSLVDGLTAAAWRGVDVQVLVEDFPVGMDDAMRSQRDALLGQVVAAGGEAWVAGSSRYRFHHLKVLVADDAVAVQTDNWVPASVNEAGSWGQRGWGVVVHDAAFADWFADWMAADRAAWDTMAWAAGPHRALPLRFPEPVGDHRPVAAMHVPGPVRVMPVVSPDHTADTDGAWIDVVRGAAARVWAQQMDVRMQASNALGWEAADPLTQALADAAGRGVDVRLQVAAPFHADDDGNRQVLAALAPYGVRGVEFARPDLGILHNKGLLIDDRFVLLGSMNGNHHSRASNREVGVLIDAPAAVAYFEGIFEADWSGRMPRAWDVPARDLAAIPATPLPMLLAPMALVLACRCCRS